MTQLVLSLFPGIEQTERFRCFDAAMDHRVVVGAQNPDVLALGIERSNGGSASRFAMVDVDDSLFATYLALSRDIWAALKESRYSGGPSAVIDHFCTPTVLRVSLVEGVSAPALSLLAALGRAIASSPVVSTNAGENRPANATGPLNVRWRSVVSTQVSQASVILDLAGTRAESLVDFIWGKRGLALSTEFRFLAGESHV